MKKIANRNRIIQVFRDICDVSIFSQYEEGIAKRDFIIELNDGKAYKGNKGFTINWSDSDEIVIVGTEDPDKAFDRGLLEGLASGIFGRFVSDSIKIEWDELVDVR